MCACARACIVERTLPLDKIYVIGFRIGEMDKRPDEMGKNAMMEDRVGCSY